MTDTFHNTNANFLPSHVAANANTTAPNMGGDWIEHLDSEAKQLVQVKGYRTPNDLVKAYIHAERAIGSEKIAIPGKEAKAEDWMPVWNKLGRPVKPEGYDFKKPEGYANYNDELAGWYRQAAHQAGLTARQAATLHDRFILQMTQAEKKQLQQIEINREKVEQELQQEWGINFDAHVAVARRAARLLADSPNMIEQLEQAIGGPQLLRLFYRLGQRLGEDNLAGGSGAGGGRLSAGQAQAEIARLQGDGDFQKKWLDKSHPEHEFALRSLQDLHRMILG